MVVHTITNTHITRVEVLAYLIFCVHQSKHQSPLAHAGWLLLTGQDALPPQYV